MTTEEFKNVYHSIPDQPGIYKFIRAAGEIIYVGKAKNLKKRVSSYFRRDLPSHKTAIMVRHASRIEYTVVETEQDALLLENQLIKNFQPKYNVSLKDDKTFPWICIKNEPFPRVFLTRKPIRDGSEFFGPYTSVHKVSSILDFIKKMYPLRTCNLNLTHDNITKKKFKVCLEYHIGNCKGPCEAKQSRVAYDKNISEIREVLKGKLGDVIQFLKLQMQEEVKTYRFEAAHDIKKKIEYLQDYQSKSLVVHPTITNVDVFAYREDDKSAYVICLRIVDGIVVQVKTIEASKKIEEEKDELLVFLINELRQQLNSRSKEIIVPFKINFPDKELKVVVPQRGDKKKLVDLAEKNLQYFLLARQQESIRHKKLSPTDRILIQLQKDFRLKELPIHIECFDNSNFQGDSPVASMVVFKNARPSKKDYRHYNIKTIEGPNDFASMEEIVYRRYKRLIDEKQALPQLIMIDGGKGQLSAAMNSLEKLDLAGHVAIAGIAKRLEEIYFPNDSLPLYVDKKSPSLRLIQQIRNEAHRFAITFHRQKRDKKTLTSELINIKGISEISAEKLLMKFRSLKKIKSAPDDELISVVGKAKTKLVKKYFSMK